MVLFNYSTKEITAKIVYYGPGLCGKTTNLQLIHSRIDPSNRGKLLSLATESDRTLFFDFLPLDLGKIGGFHVRFQLYTVPGQVHYNATRRMVLKGVDAVVFVADSQAEMLESNRESFENLKDNLVENGYKIENIPIVLQANKRDLPNVTGTEEIVQATGGSDYQIFEAVACRGDGVFETLRAIIKLAVSKLQSQFQDEDLQEPAMDGFMSPVPVSLPSQEPQPLFTPDTPMMESPPGEARESAVTGHAGGEEAVTALSQAAEETAGENAAPPGAGDLMDDGEEPAHGETLNLEDEISFDDAFDDDTIVDEVVDGKAVEELDLEQLEHPGAPPPPVEAAATVRGTPPEGGGDSSLDLLSSRVEDLSREVDRLREENRTVRGMVERILSGIGRQMEVLEQVMSGRGERAEGEGSQKPQTPPPETGR